MGFYQIHGMSRSGEIRQRRGIEKRGQGGRALSWLVHGTRACETWASDQIQEVQPKYYHLDGSLSQEQKQFRVASSLVVMLLFFFSALRW